MCTLQEMVSDVTTLCMRVMRLQGAQVQQLMTADYEMCASLSFNNTATCVCTPRIHSPPQLWCTLCTQLSLRAAHLSAAPQMLPVMLSDTPPRMWAPQANPLVPPLQGVLHEGLEGRGEVAEGGAGPQLQRRAAQARAGRPGGGSRQAQPVRSCLASSAMHSKHTWQSLPRLHRIRSKYVPCSPHLQQIDSARV